MTDLKKCTMCLNEYPPTLEYFYKGKKALRSRCKTCLITNSIKSINHNTNALKYYYKNQDLQQGKRMKRYIENRFNIAIC
jgi:hypothetical protein